MTTLLAPLSRRARLLMWVYVDTGLAIIGLMALLGLTMRLAQAQWITIDPGLFYAMMTLHGAGMITAIAMCGMGIVWYLMRLEGKIDERLAYVAYAIIVAGVVGVILSVFPGHFGAAWTFLYPLPFVGATWPSWATGSFLIGVSLVSLGWTIWCSQILSATLRRYGSLAGALGWDAVFHPDRLAAAGREAPSPQALAATVVAIDGLLTGAAGMVICVAMLVHWITPAVPLDPLWAKNVTYFFGHAIANLTIYMAVTAVYVGMPRYTQREYHTSAPLIIAWWGTLLFVAIAYFHHLYMDFVQFRPLQFIGEAASYLAAVPTVVVTVFGAAMLVYRSRLRWSLGSIFLYAGLIGWVVGGMGAVIDATIPVNFSLHNTLWVPAHFHTYLLEGTLLFVLGWVFMLLEERSTTISLPVVRWSIATGIFGGGALLLGSWYLAGALGIARRYSMQPAPGPEVAGWASIGAVILLVGLTLALIEGVRLATRKNEVES